MPCEVCLQQDTVSFGTWCQRDEDHVASTMMMLGWAMKSNSRLRLKKMRDFVEARDFITAAVHFGCGSFRMDLKWIFIAWHTDRQLCSWCTLWYYCGQMKCVHFIYIFLAEGAIIQLCQALNQYKGNTGLLFGKICRINSHGLWPKMKSYKARMFKKK